MKRPVYCDMNIIFSNPCLYPSQKIKTTILYVHVTFFIHATSSKNYNLQDL